MGKTIDDKRYKKTTAKIHGALARLLGKHDISDITVYALCQRAGITRGTFYRHYKSISDVVSSTEHELFESYLSLYKTIPDDTRTPRKIMYSTLLIISRNRDFFRMLIMQQNYRLLLRIFTHAHPLLRKRWEGLLNYKDDDTLSALSCFSGYGVMGLITYWVMEHNADKELIGHYAEMADVLVKYGVGRYAKPNL